MRTFISIELPFQMQEYISEIQEQLVLNDTKIKLVDKKNLHLTLKFLGEIDDKKIDQIKKSLSKIKFTPQTISISEIGVFPSENYIRVVWIGIEPAEKICELQQQIESVLYEIGIKKESRTFETHVTLGRVKFVKDKKHLLEKIKSIKIKTEEFTLDSFKLKKSTLTEKGAIYEDIVCA